MQPYNTKPPRSKRSWGFLFLVLWLSAEALHINLLKLARSRDYVNLEIIQVLDQELTFVSCGL